jgi:hypothetical protein
VCRIWLIGVSTEKWGLLTENYEVRGTLGPSVKKKGWKEIASAIKRRPLEWSVKNTMGIRK